MYQIECGNPGTQVQEKTRCASLTRKGRPCKARRHADWLPFCHSHAPTGPVEFVGGGPLDGLCLANSFDCHDHPDTITIAYTAEGKVVVYAPSFVWWQGMSRPRATIGLYRQEYQDLVPVWQWEAAAE